jgi:Xaa-Pro dipeptidase
MNDTLLPGKGENPGALPFAPEEFQLRRERACELLRQQRIDLAIISSPVNFYYLTGMHTGVSHYIFVLALRPNGEGLWIVRRTEMSNVWASAAHSWVKEGIPVDDSEDPQLKLADIVGKLVGPAATVGLEFSSPQVSVAAYIKLQAAAPQMRFVDISGVVESLRVFKSQAELAYMRRAGTICGTAMQEALENLRPGVRDSDLATDLIGRAIRLGSEPMAMGPFVTCGLRSFRAHSSWVHEPIGSGELINTEMAAVVARYNTPVFRVSVLGKPSNELFAFHDASLAGLQAGLEKIEAGMTSQQADSIVRDAITKAGFGEFFTVRAAYGIGVGFPPGWGENNVMNIRPKDERLLQPDMCFHLVPALYKRGLGCVCCSMPIHITESGVERLTNIEPKLFVVDADG